LEPPGSPLRKPGEEILRAQINAVLGRASKVVFIPGNHDWDDANENGWDAIRRQEEFIEQQAGRGSFLPRGGCPGPLEVQQYHSAAKLVVIDSQWWLHEFEKPGIEDALCAASTESQFEELLRNKVRVEPGQYSVIVQHHPIESFGKHGQRARCPQDSGCKRYREMKDAMIAALKSQPALLCAAGHDHNLQLIRGKQACRYYLVSGALSFPAEYKIAADLLFAFDGLGFFRLDELRDKRLRLAAIGNSADQRGTELFVTFLER